MLIVCTQANPLLVAGVCFPKSVFQILQYNVEDKDVCLYQQHQRNEYCVCLDGDLLLLSNLFHFNRT